MAITHIITIPEGQSPNAALQRGKCVTVPGIEGMVTVTYVGQTFLLAEGDES